MQLNFRARGVGWSWREKEKMKGDVDGRGHGLGEESDIKCIDIYIYRERAKKLSTNFPSP